MNIEVLSKSKSNGLTELVMKNISKRFGATIVAEKLTQEKTTQVVTER